MHTRHPRILCIEPDLSLLDSRCGVLKHNGYDTYAASLNVTEVVLAAQSFDLIILSSRLTETEKQQIAQAAADTEQMVLGEITFPSTLLSEVAQRLMRSKWKVAV
jgi:DNA-binding response OmpR family regulator